LLLILEEACKGVVKRERKNFFFVMVLGLFGRQRLSAVLQPLQIAVFHDVEAYGLTYKVTPALEKAQLDQPIYLLDDCPSVA